MIKISNINSSFATDRYENMFSVGQDQNGNFYFNLTEGQKVNGDIPEEFLASFKIPQKMSWHNVQYDIYGSMNLWWAIFLANPELNPMEFPYAGQNIKVIRKEIIPTIIQEINK